jgi:tetratricopeptide (TPR) repeat protein
MAGEAALARGDSGQGFELLAQASKLGVGPQDVGRLVEAFASAGRYQSRQAEVLAWVETLIEEGTTEPGLRAQILATRLVLCHGVDFARVGTLTEAALEAAEAAGDEASYARILSCAASAAYRRGDVRGTGRFAEMASTRPFRSRAAQFHALRAGMFEAVALGEVEQALNLSIKARAVARELGYSADVANESNNLAECYLELGCPIEARACAEQGVELARVCGYYRVEIFGRVLAAVATAEAGEIDAAIARFDEIPFRGESFFMVDAAAASSFWLLERGSPGDAEAACAIAGEAVTRANARGVRNRLTPLYSSIARGLARQGRREEAQMALEQARLAADSTEPPFQLLLALAVAELLPDSDPRRGSVLTNARARILRAAERREDPYVYCTEVRLHRRLLELSGGVPTDLPRAP